MKFAVGTKNKAKLESVRDAIERCKLLADTTPEAAEGLIITGVETSSGVSAQPMSVTETRTGALARARGALAAVPDADVGIGLDGGLEIVPGFGEPAGEGQRCAVAAGAGAGAAVVPESAFVVGWACVVHRGSGTVGWGCSARLELPPQFLRELRSGAGAAELSQVIDAAAAAHDLRSGLGVEGLLTGGALCRGEAYTHALVFAFARFLSPAGFWS